MVHIRWNSLAIGERTEEKLQNTLNHETRTDDDEDNNDEGNNEEIPTITDEEIQAAINKLKPATTMESEPKTSRPVMMRRKKL